MALCNCGASATRLVITTRDNMVQSLQYMCRGDARKATNTSMPSASRGHSHGIRVTVSRLPVFISLPDGSKVYV